MSVADMRFYKFYAASTKLYLECENFLCYNVFREILLLEVFMRAELRYLGNSLVIDGFRHYPQEAAIGNPHNSSFNLRVASNSFAGTAPCEYDINKFKVFVAELEELYRFERKTVVLFDIGYGSKVTFYMDRRGILKVDGTIFGERAEHSLTFTFEGDQTALPPFIAELSAIVANR